MKKIDRTVLTETGYIAVWCVILSVLMEAVFLILGKWSADVLFGNLISAAGAVLNFFLMGLTVQSAVNREEKNAATLMRLSQNLRLLMQFAVAGVGVLCFDPLASVIPLFFPRVAIVFRKLFLKKKENR